MYAEEIGFFAYFLCYKLRYFNQYNFLRIKEQV